MNDSSRVLVVEDDSAQLKLLQNILTNEGYVVSGADSCESAIILLKKKKFDVVFSDWKLPQLSGLDLLNFIRKQFPELGFVMATAHGTISHAVQAMHAGADDYLAKPFQRQELLLSIQKAQKAVQLRRTNEQLHNALNTQGKLVDLIGTSQAMSSVQQRIQKIAPTDVTVLITGESGTGKELLARSIHNLSLRHARRFVAINCGAIPHELAEAELFGALKGAYTGAVADKVGKLAYADKGTLFLDEIGELAPDLQAKLLRFLQEGTITPVGSNQEQQLDVRVIAATHRDLPHMVKQGEFREDLFYRLNIVPVKVPPLRERKNDIKLLAEYFYQKQCKQYGIESGPLPPEVLTSWEKHSWPGNVRELSNCVERYALLGDVGEFSHRMATVDELDAYQLPEHGIDFEGLEKSLLQQALAMSKGNKTKACKLLNLSYKAFLYRLEKYDLEK